MRADPLLGQTMAGGRYRIAGRVGTGGMGTVYRAEQMGLGRGVALKVLRREAAFDRETVARFHREAKAMSLLVHPNTVRVFDFGEDERGHLYLAMELLVGELLSARIDREGVLDVEEAIQISREILRSLHEAHSKGIVHRDLKPDNIYLASVEGHAAPVVKVLDFGIAKVFRDEGKIDQLETQAGTVFGTPRYMSPEQAQGKPLDPRSDLYAVGVLLYQMLTGRPPFVDEDAVVVMAKHIRDVPDPVRKAAPDRPIPPSLEQLVVRSMEKDPDKRYTTADELDRALAAVIPDVLREKELHATGRRSSELWSTVRRTPRVAWAIGALVVLLSVLGASVIAMTSSSGAAASEAAGQTGIVATPILTAPPPVPPPPQQVLLATRHVVLGSEPPGAEIWRDGERIGTTPQAFDVAEGTPAVVQLRLAEHQLAIVDLASSAPEETVTLVPTRPGLSHPERASAPPQVDDRTERPRRGGRGGRGRRDTARDDEPATTTTQTAAQAQPRDPYERFE